MHFVSTYRRLNQRQHKCQNKWWCSSALRSGSAFRTDLVIWSYYTFWVWLSSEIWTAHWKQLTPSKNSSESNSQYSNCSRKEQHSWWIALILILVLACSQPKSLLWTPNTELFLTCHSRPYGIKLSLFSPWMTTFHWFMNQFHTRFHCFLFVWTYSFPFPEMSYGCPEFPERSSLGHLLFGS